MSNIYEKLEKLFRMAGNSASTEEEAVAFMQKAYDLMKKYNISPDNIVEKDILLDEEIYTPKVDTSWFQKLAIATSTLYFSGVYRKKIPNKEQVRFTNEGLSFTMKPIYAFVGKKHNRIVACKMFEYFMQTMERMEKETYTNPRDKVEFSKGFSYRMQERILKEIKISKVFIEVNGNSDRLPMVIENEDQAIALYIEQHTNKKGVKKKVKISEAAIEGYKAANNVSLNKQVGSEIIDKPKFLNTVERYLLK